MAIEVTEAINVPEQAAALGLAVPTHLTVLPRNFETAEALAELAHESPAATIRKLWREAGLPETPLELDGQRLPRMLDRSADWVGPTIFVGSLLLTENQHAVSLAISIVKDYVVNFFKGWPNPPQVKLDVIVETSESKKYRRIHYSGSADGLSELPAIIQEAAKEDDV